MLPKFKTEVIKTTAIRIPEIITKYFTHEIPLHIKYHFKNLFRIILNNVV